MNIEVKEHFKVLTPDEGKILTNGEVTSHEVAMPLDGDTSKWWDTFDSPDATSEDYETSLNRLGL